VWGQDWSELDGSCLLVSGEVSGQAADCGRERGSGRHLPLMSVV
jgi:hypothetical protein